MEKVLTSELTKYLLLLGAVSIGLYALMIRLASKSRAGFKTFQKDLLIYIIVAAILFGLITISAHPALSVSPSANLLIFQAYFLLLGVIHLWFMYNKLKLTSEEHDFVSELLLSIIVGCLGAAVFLLIYRRFNNRGFEFEMIGSVLFFLIPLFFVESFRNAVAIPPKVRRQWFYPVDLDIEEPEDSKLKNLIVISFEFLKDPEDNTITNFRAKAPMEMEFGELFYYFINDYNERNRNSKIRSTNDRGEPFGWIFFKRNKSFSFLTNYIDAEATIKINKIKENDVIICQRVKNNAYAG
jgi:hypothetical protein